MLLLFMSYWINHSHQPFSLSLSPLSFYHSRIQLPHCMRVVVIVHCTRVKLSCLLNENRVLGKQPRDNLLYLNVINFCLGRLSERMQCFPEVALF